MIMISFPNHLLDKLIPICRSLFSRVDEVVVWVTPLEASFRRHDLKGLKWMEQKLNRIGNLRLVLNK